MLELRRVPGPVEPYPAAYRLAAQFRRCPDPRADAALCSPLGAAVRSSRPARWKDENPTRHIRTSVREDSRKQTPRCRGSPTSQVLGHSNSRCLRTYSGSPRGACPNMSSRIPVLSSPSKCSSRRSHSSSLQTTMSGSLAQQLGRGTRALPGRRPMPYRIGPGPTNAFSRRNAARCAGRIGDG